MSLSFSFFLSWACVLLLVALGVWKLLRLEQFSMLLFFLHSLCRFSFTDLRQGTANLFFDQPGGPDWFGYSVKGLTSIARPALTALDRRAEKWERERERERERSRSRRIRREKKTAHGQSERARPAVIYSFSISFSSLLVVEFSLSLLFFPFLYSCSNRERERPGFGFSFPIFFFFFFSVSFYFPAVASDESSCRTAGVGWACPSLLFSSCWRLTDAEFVFLFKTWGREGIGRRMEKANITHTARRHTQTQEHAAEEEEANGLWTLLA